MIKTHIKLQFAITGGENKGNFLILIIKSTVDRNNHKFTLNKLLGGSIYLEASQSTVVEKYD